MPRPLFFLLRACFGLFVFLTCSYCLLAFVPFTYQQVHVGGALPWLTFFARYHSYIYWLVLEMVVVTLLPDLRRPQTKILTAAFIFVSAIAGYALLLHPLLQNLQNDNASYYWGLVSLLPLLWLAVIDFLAQRKMLMWAPAGIGEDHRIFWAAWRSALFLTFLYTAIFYFRYRASGTSGFGLREGILSLSWSLVYHFLVFISLFVILYMMRALAALFEKRSRTEFILAVVVAGLLVTGILRFLMFPQFSFDGPLANVFAVAAGFSFALSSAGLSLKLFDVESTTIHSGLTLLLTPLRWGSFFPKAARLVPLMIVTFLAFVLAVKSGGMDWNFLVQKLAVLFIWTATFASFYELAPRKETKDVSLAMVVVAVVVTLVGYKTLGTLQEHYQSQGGPGSVDVASVLDTYAGYDISFKLAYDALSPVRSNPSFYKFLTENTNIPRSTPTHPVEVNLVDNLVGDNSPKPNIFIFVIDSLRRDYISTYNHAVTFTPNIDAFAHESVVMENAMTEYGGTGLSEPSIWVGGMLLHQQYTTPFYPMNALYKLLDAEKYQSFIGKDTILDVIVPPSPRIIEMENNNPQRLVDFCSSLDDLTGKINAIHDPNVPLFAYTQAQNIHISVINREGETVIDGQKYPGFYAPYASRLRRIDSCFGKFIQFAKSSGIYDKSIIILTADHGDSLGENGRWGHSYALFPEIVRIPMLIHMPSALRAGFSVSPDNLAFLTDITPSLYYILGQRPIRRNGIFGRPLFTKTRAEEAQYLRESYLVASSYGAVYGMLKDNGHSLYVVDAIDYKDYFYELPTGYSPRSLPVTPSIQAEYEQLIRDQIMAINSFYQFQPQH